ncbi:hypothetical protein BDV29DRAFT_185406 [Aspergillus leporis]|uniref:Uncharacterized protein n=1 Tax=Aspergillus leporis TaxID=41062 RepID=A0A5N5WHH3_9EURO|nr:hypothetical protein BDV29DRAFT_185406 [Aspergillus leporis]
MRTQLDRFNSSEQDNRLRIDQNQDKMCPTRNNSRVDSTQRKTPNDKTFSRWHFCGWMERAIHYSVACLAFPIFLLLSHRILDSTTAFEG